MTDVRMRELRALPRPPLESRVEKLIAAGDWAGARAVATPANAITVTIESLLAHPVIATWPKALALAIAAGDFPRREYRRLCEMLRVLHERNLRVFDGKAARRAFGALPTRVPIYRGTCMAEFESREWGICWTLERAAAEGFALRHEIARLAAARRPDSAAELVPDGFESDSVVLTATVSRDDTAGLLTRLGEQEVLVHPHRLVSVAPLPDDRPAVRNATPPPATCSRTNIPITCCTCIGPHEVAP